MIFKTAPLDFPRKTGCNYEQEKGRLKDAVSQAVDDLLTLSEDLSGRFSRDEGELLKAQAMMAEDPELERQSDAALHEGRNAEAAWVDAIEFYAEQIESLADPNLKARAADVRDMGRRVLRYLMNLPPTEEVRISEPRVLIAEDLAPSETASLDRSKVLAFCTAGGGATSHTVILARAMGIPAVAGLGKVIMDTPDNTNMLVNGHTGAVTLNPDNEMRETFRREASRQDERISRDISEAGEPAMTTDGHTVAIAANIGNLEDARAAVGNGAEGIGLFRTEFLFLGRDTPPDEETQYQAYREVLAAVKGLPVIARTLDAGGDKQIPYLATVREDNPFLGWRSIRICLDDPEFFRTQLRALLRAGAGYDLRIMFPMITGTDELRHAKEQTSIAQQELAARNISFNNNVPLGIMIETPAAVVMADRLAGEAAFFSIGTNDLTQYTMAADRTNTRVAGLNDACHPAILQQIKTVTEAGRAAGIPTGICGELAADPEAIPVLLGLGVNELSMAPASIPGAKSLVRLLSLEKSQKLALKVLEMETAAEVRAYVKSFIQQIKR